MQESINSDGGADALATAVVVVCVDGSKLTEVTEAIGLMDVTEVMVVETLWPLPLLLSVSVDED